MALFLGLCFLQGSHVLMSLAPSGSESLALKRDPYTKPSIEEASSIPTLVREKAGDEGRNVQLYLTFKHDNGIIPRTVAVLVCCAK
jgi:hypothetical protein